jgi:predicted ATP-binding protein involved in virulence
MFRRLFQTSPAGPEIEPEAPHETLRATPCHPGLGKFDSFDEIYRSGPANQTHLPYDIMKVSQMLESPHIATMSVESKRGSLMMALDAAGAEPKDILQDAMVRQRALSDYEESQQRKLRDFEAFKAEQNHVVQEELDQINTEYLARIQVNINEVAKQQDSLRAWQRNKQHELTAIAEACGYLAPSEVGGSSLAAALDRAARR